jgi:hypothetical protein
VRSGEDKGRKIYVGKIVEGEEDAVVMEPSGGGK